MRAPSRSLFNLPSRYLSLSHLSIVQSSVKTEWGGEQSAQLNSVFTPAVSRGQSREREKEREASIKRYDVGRCNVYALPQNCPYIPSRDWLSSQIAGLMRVPPPVINIVHVVSFALLLSRDAELLNEESRDACHRYLHLVCKRDYWLLQDLSVS